jgi:gamma-glutamylcysteine synthetase
VNESGQHSVPTYGGEVETLAVQCGTWRLFPLDTPAQKQVQAIIEKEGEHAVQPVNLDYDEAQHILEFQGAVSYHLPQLVTMYQQAIATTCRLLQRQCQATLLSSSFHPFEDPVEAYQHVVPKPLYDLFRGYRPGLSSVSLDTLKKIYPTEPERGRGWWHEIGSLAASVQPWNSLTLEQAASQIAVLQACGWMFTLLTANAPFYRGKVTGKRDYRLEIWKGRGMLARSRYLADRANAKNLPSKPMGLTDYYAYVLKSQRPMVIPQPKKAHHNYKLAFLGVVQPEDWREFNTLTYLQAKSIRAVDIETGEVQEVRPSVAHICNGFDFLYYPGGGARIRIHLPEADRLDPRLFAQAIKTRNEPLLHELLREAKVHLGFICAEGRASATVLPTQKHPGWERLSIPFVLQTALIRSHQEVFAFLESTPLTWHDLTCLLPARCNARKHGFATQIKGIDATELARHIWMIARQSLTEEERSLVRDEIDEILNRRMAAAEEQLALFEMLSLRYPRTQALLKLVEQLCMG